MRCHEINELFSAYFDGLLDPSVQNTVSLHLEECAACRTEFEDLAMVVGLVRNLPMVEPPVQFGKGLRSQLESLKPSPGAVKRLFPGRWPAVLALAASFFVVFGIAGAWPDLAPRLGINKEAGMQSQVADRTSSGTVVMMDKSTPEARDSSENSEKTLSVNDEAAPAVKNKEVAQKNNNSAKQSLGAPLAPRQSQNTEIAAAPPRIVDSGGMGVTARGAVPGGHLLMAAPADPAERAFLNIKADDIGAAMRQISDVARINGGSVEVPRELGVSELTVTIPDSQFDNVMAEIAKVGKVTINNNTEPEIKMSAKAEPTVTGVYGKNDAETGITSLQAPEEDSDRQLEDKNVSKDTTAPTGEDGVSVIRVKFE
ncbi:MAG: hypothetical protein JL50_04945 [Peptococcaceae bacterium BICA1-7]|nr:MAG: hypothetical protein JL50_04945 [Peptococcaceae bacterium BICA1-7]HBV95966.1 hypothetical protein [Desulfotomaculum sp.]